MHSYKVTGFRLTQMEGNVWSILRYVQGIFLLICKASTRLHADKDLSMINDQSFILSIFKTTEFRIIMHAFMAPYGIIFEIFVYLLLSSNSTLLR